MGVLYNISLNWLTKNWHRINDERSDGLTDGQTGVYIH